MPPERFTKGGAKRKPGQLLTGSFGKPQFFVLVERLSAWLS